MSEEEYISRLGKKYAYINRSQDILLRKFQDDSFKYFGEEFVDGEWE